MTIQRFLRTAAIYGAIALGLAAITPTSSASATGKQRFGGFTWDSPAGVPVYINECELFHEIIGEDRKITHQMAQVTCFPTKAFSLCNWRIDFHYANGDTGKTYKINKGKTVHDCNVSPKRSVQTNHTVKHYGKACAHFILSGKRRAVQCHEITK